ncbi:MAG: phospholipase, partial [Polyangiaceae bacterium]
MRLTKLGDLDVRVTGGSDGEGAGDGPVVVLLHGFGAPGDDLVPIGRALKAPRDTRFVFPEAPLSLGGAAAGGRAWWWIDLEERIRRRAAQDTDVSEVPSGLHDARAKIERLLVATERALHPPPGKIVLGGFSQGAMLSLDVALASNATLAGILLMSGSHIAAKEWAARFETRRGLPVFMSHGQ